MPAVAVTDRANLFCLVRFFRAAVAAGIKPIIGVDLPLERGSTEEPGGVLTLLAMDESGYRRISRLLTRCYMAERSTGLPVAERAWVSECTDGVIAISPGPGGDVGQAFLHGRVGEAERRAERWASAFPGRFYLGVQRTGRTGDEPCLESTVDLAFAMALPVVAANDVRFLERDDFEAHEARVCIQEGRVLADPRRPRMHSEEQYLKSPEEMAALFEDLPGALENTVEVARRCSFDFSLGGTWLPEFPVPQGHDLEEWFAARARSGLRERLGTPGGESPPDDAGGETHAHRQRLEMELGVICRMGYPGYFLIVADFIQWAREHRIPVGPGRGSGAGSLVAYALGITDLDPLRYDLLFERFLNPERVSLPDFDIDFCMEGRDRVIEYVANRYSPDHVAQIITFGTMAAKAVVRDVGRVLGHPYGFVDEIAKLIPFELGITLERALAEDALKQRYESDDEVRGIIDLARKLEGLARNAGRHAGGVVIAPKRLTEFTPLYREPGATGAVTQFDKDDVEAIGLVKFDFLGLRTLTIIDWAVSTTNENRRAAGEDPLDLKTLPTDDSATYELIRSGSTTAVFQLESRGMKDLIRRLQPDCFDDIIALVALFRPGPLQSGMVEDFVARKHGLADFEYLDPALESTLKPTYGVILYQEQVMKIAQVLAGYSLGEADLLRRAMGKKKPAEMAKHRDVFVQGAIDRGVEKRRAVFIFDLMEKFAGYGFNKSHSAAYALLSYQTAWLKAHYPAAFMSAVLSADMDSTDKVVNFVEESRAQGLTVAASVQRRRRAKHPVWAWRGQGRRRGGNRERDRRARAQRAICRSVRLHAPSRSEAGQPARHRGAHTGRRARPTGSVAFVDDADPRRRDSGRGADRPQFVDRPERHVRQRARQRRRHVPVRIDGRVVGGGASRGREGDPRALPDGTSDYPIRARAREDHERQARCAPPEPGGDADRRRNADRTENDQHSQRPHGDRHPRRSHRTGRRAHLCRAVLEMSRAAREGPPARRRGRGRRRRVLRRVLGDRERDP